MPDVILSAADKQARDDADRTTDPELMDAATTALAAIIGEPEPAAAAAAAPAPRSRSGSPAPRSRSGSPVSYLEI